MAQLENPPRRTWSALVGALVLHALAFVAIERASEHRVFEVPQRAPIELQIVAPRPPAEPEEKAPEEAPAPERAPRAEPRPVLPPVAPPPSDAVPEPAPDAQPDVAVPTTPPTSAEVPASNGSLLRLRKDDGAIGRVLGTGAALAPSASVLEGALDQRGVGPLSDRARVERRVKELVLADLADDEVTAGLTDDYFRELRNRVETQWRPAMKDLSDGGARVTQIGMMRDVFAEREAWGEMWNAYLDLAKQYANGVKPTLEPARKERLRELMRSRKGAFRFHAISEVVVTQGPDGQVLTIEMPLESGHRGIDEGVKDALVTAVRAMPDPPSARVHGGQSFSSTWRFRASWVMVPPTAFFTGAGFDITPKGFQLDVPFDIQLKTNVMLLRTLTQGRVSTDVASPGADP